jgi:hypothetical protein
LRAKSGPGNCANIANFSSRMLLLPFTDLLAKLLSSGLFFIFTKHETHTNSANPGNAVI